MYGRVIIAERNLAAADKTIAPTDIGGLAGGDKFVVHDIVFKFPTTAAPGTTSSAMYVQQHQRLQRVPSDTHCTHMPLQLWCRLRCGQVCAT